MMWYIASLLENLSKSDTLSLLTDGQLLLESYLHCFHSLLCPESSNSSVIFKNGFKMFTTILFFHCSFLETVSANYCTSRCFRLVFLTICGTAVPTDHGQPDPLLILCSYSHSRVNSDKCFCKTFGGEGVVATSRSFLDGNYSSGLEDIERFLCKYFSPGLEDIESRRIMEGSKLNVPRGYDDLHRLFLQHFMKKRMLTLQEAFQVYSAMYSRMHDGAPVQQEMEQAVQLINKAIKGLRMEIQIVTDEVTEERYYALIPTMSSSTGRLFARYSSSEIEFFKKVVTEILNAENSAVSSTFCLNLNSLLPGNVSKSNLEKLIKELCDDLWLIHKEGKIRLSPLAIAELEPMLKETYKDQITMCTLCNHIVLQGSQCDNCNSLFHSYCMSRYTRTFSSENCPCPSCNEKMSTNGNVFDIDD